MKKEILAMMACGMMMTSAYAQEIKNGDFESGDLTSWNVWEKKDNKIVDAKKAHSGNYAVEVKVGMWQAVNISYETGAEYQISAYTKYIGVTNLTSGLSTIIRIQRNWKKLPLLRSRKTVRITILQQLNSNCRKMVLYIVSQLFRVQVMVDASCLMMSR